jgi:hypothetical protein
MKYLRLCKKINANIIEIILLEGTRVELNIPGECLDPIRQRWANTLTSPSAHRQRPNFRHTIESTKLSQFFRTIFRNNLNQNTIRIPDIRSKLLNYQNFSLKKK